MKQPYIVSQTRRFGFVGPFKCEQQRRVWGLQWVIVCADNCSGYACSVSFNGNAKQRRQQRRALVKMLNAV